MTKKQRKAEAWATMLDSAVGPNATSRKWRADSKRVEKRKRAQFRRSQ